MIVLASWGAGVGFVLLTIGLFFGWLWATVIGTFLIKFLLVVLGATLFIALRRPRAGKGNKKPRRSGVTGSGFNPDPPF